MFGLQRTNSTAGTDERGERPPDDHQMNVPAVAEDICFRLSSMKRACQIVTYGKYPQRRQDRKTLIRVGLLGTEGLQRCLDPGNVRGGQLEPMPQQTGEEVQRLSSRRGEPVDPIPDLQQLQQGRVLRSLSVRVVKL
ncbi:hypothetical protein EYF80_012866 [Liparis tanakae]|uniref:Uncharacterized protein n=1 Tax=Liparis tanakae TaxID=230148 RepID=A0A4Z2IHZ4_9TELE|nr:hypothetical protein EYF80_012866 [Liparis tanakae]